MPTLTNDMRDIDPNSDFDVLGGGFSFPLRITESGGTKVTIGEENVKSAIRHIATYRKQELYGTASFGSNTPAMIFSVFSVDSLTLYETWMRDAIEAWENRATSVRVTAGKAVNSKDNTKVLMLINYRVESTGTYDYIEKEAE